MLYFIASWHLFVFLSVYCPAHLYSSSAPFSSKETAFSYDVYVNGIWHSEGLCYQGMQFNFVQVRKCAGNLWVCWKLLEQIVYKTTKQTDVSILHRALQLDTGRYSPMHSHTVFWRGRIKTSCRLGGIAETAESFCRERGPWLPAQELTSGSWHDFLPCQIHLSPHRTVEETLGTVWALLSLQGKHWCHWQPRLALLKVQN